MSDNHAPLETTQDAVPSAVAGTVPGVAPAIPQPSGSASKKPSTFLRVSIILLIGLTLASISLLFIGDFEGRFERVFSTFALFAVFVLLTAVDTNRERVSEWYAPVALIANTYILGLLLVVIWMTPFTSYGLILEIFWKSFFVIIVTRLVILCCEVLLRLGKANDDAGNSFAFITSVLAVLSGILFTAPVGIEAFNLRVPDLYWKIATAVLILTALGLSVTLLLRWANNSDERAAKRAAATAARAVADGQALAPAPFQGGAQLPASDSVHAEQPAQPASPQPSSPGAPAAGQEQVVLLPWPTFADGRPIPARPDGQPDFSVPGAPLPPQQ